MLVFSTRIPLNDVISMQDCFDVFSEWVTGSPHYGLDSMEYDVNTGLDFDYSKEFLNISIRQFHEEQISVLACRLQYNDADAAYCTDCIFSCENQEKSLLIQLNRNQINHEVKLPRVKKPYILRHVIDYDFYKEDANIPVVDRPLIAEEYLDVCVDVMNGVHNNVMPVVYISRDYWDKTAVNPEYLAQQLGGIAHVFVERDHNTAIILREKTDGNNPHSGYVGIYSPKTKYCRKYSNNDYSNNRRMAWDIINAVWAVQINRLDSSKYNWNQVVALLSRQRMAEWRDISDIARTELDELIQSHAKEVADLKEQRDTLNKQLYDTETERDTYKARLVNCTNQDGFFYNAGEEKPLYSSEQNDLLYSILSQVQSNFPEKSRPYALIQSMLDANPRVGDCESILNDVERALSDGGKLNSSSKSLLRKNGFVITEDTKHYHLMFHDSRYMFTTSKTPGECRRGGKNLVGEIRRTLDVERKI